MPQFLTRRPNLAQLRQQAKELHHAYHAGNPQAIERVERIRLAIPTAPRLVLADAQYVVAREYGFASWPKLKQHVQLLLAAQAAERMLDVRQQRKLARRQRVAERAASLVAAAHARDLPALFATLVAPAWEIEAVRARLVELQTFSFIVDALLDGVDHPQPRVRFLTAQALDHFADQRCAAPLQRLLHDPVPRVRWAALHSLQCATCKLEPLVTDTDIVATVIHLALHDPSIKVRRTATYELGNQPADPRAVAALRQLAANETDNTIVRTVRRALAHS